MTSLSHDISTPVIVALDYPNAEQALVMARQLNPAQCRVKVGKELYTRCGPAILESLHELGFEVFLDLKFHDIPNTTANAVAVAAELGVWMVNVHASGGEKMMRACADKLAAYSKPPLLIGVTVLTSMERQDLIGLGLDLEPIEQVRRLARLTQESGLDGIVCSSQEVSVLRDELGEDFKFVTPGIRPAFASNDDQKRIMTPQEALEAGSDYLVIGRPITKASDPMDALSKVLAEVS
jgi:orotidine-5'-phosphate decarboxylase